MKNLKIFPAIGLGICVAVAVAFYFAGCSEKKKEFPWWLNVPAADFTADPVAGPLPHTVDFTDTSKGNVTSWAWDFGDGETSIHQNPSHKYRALGTYSVSLTVAGPGSSDTETKVDYINVSTGNSSYGFEQPLNNEWEMVGDAEIISDNPQSGQYCLKLGAMGRAILPVSDDNVYGKVSFWVKDSMVECPSSNAASIGPIFGLQNKDGDMLLCGILRRDFLNLSKYGCVLTAENNFWALRNLGAFPYVDRTGAWQKWAIEVSGPGVINIFVNDELKNVSDSLKQYFSKGFTGVYFRGDFSAGPEEFSFDEVTVEVSGEGQLGQIDSCEFPEPRAISNVLQNANFFPIAVWAMRLDYMDYFKALGVNISIGEVLQFGPTTREEFLDGLYSKGLYGMVMPGWYVDLHHTVDPVIISQLINHPALLAWRQRDEPDLLSSVKPGLKSDPWEIKERYDLIGPLDSEHSVYLNFSTGPGSTTRFVQPADYFEYCEGADILSFDIYPITNYPNGEKFLYSVADGIDNLKKWSNDKKPLWIWLESRTGDYRAPTPQEMRAEVWMVIIHGADGFGWFVAEFDPFRWHAIPPELEVEMTDIAQTLQTLAPVINSSERDDVLVRMITQGRIDVISRIHDNKLYFFTVNMMNKEVDAEFIFPAQYSGSEFTVINEDRTIEISQGVFTEHFGPFEVHLYGEIE